MSAVAALRGEFAISDLLREAASHALRFPSRHGPTVSIDERVMAGTVMSAEVQPGLLISGRDIRYLDDGVFDGASERSLTCGLLLDGEADPLVVPGHPPVLHERRRLTVLGFGETTPWTRRYRQRQRNRAFGLTITPAFFDRFEASVSDAGLSGLRGLLRGGFRVEQLPASRLLASLASQMTDHPYSGALSDLFQESAALRFVAEVELMLKEETRLRAALGGRRYDQVRRARAMLDGALVAPPRTLDLAHALGTNVTSLQAGFKQAYGVTLFGYVRDQRLAMARVLIDEHGLGVAEAGYRVGFTSASAFTAAFRRRFGAPPSSLR